MSLEYRILFVCMGNICRSPLAEGIARGLYEGWRDYRLDNELSINAKRGDIVSVFDSAGISGFHRGESPCKGSQEVAKEHGIDIAMLRSRPVRIADGAKFDYLVAMDSENISSLKEMGFAQRQILRIGDFGDGQDIPDPYYYRDMQGFEMIFEMLYGSIKKFLQEIKILN